MSDLFLKDEEGVVWGTDDKFHTKVNTNDANARMLTTDLPSGGDVVVPVYAVGIRLDGVDLGVFNGFTQPMMALVDLDHDSYLGFHYSADDVGVVEMSVGGGTVRQHILPNVASDTFALIAATQTLTNKTLGASTVTGDMTFNDLVNITLGTGGDADLFYNGTNVILNPAVVGSGVLVLGGGEAGTTAATGTTVRVPDVATGGTGDVVGADFTTGPGLGTGTGDVGRYIWSLPIVAASGDNIQTRAERLALDMIGSSTVLTMAAAQGLIISTSSGDIALNPTGNVYINESAAVNTTLGLVINQGANDNRILEFKSSDVAHGITGQDETDTYMSVQKQSGASGGVIFRANTAATSALAIYANYTTDDTTKSTSGRGATNFWAQKKSGVGVGSPGADANLLAILDGGVGARFLFDVEGSAHADVEWVAFAQHDDLTLVSDMEATLLDRESPEQTYRRHSLEELGIIGEGSWHMELERPRAMVNFTRLSMVHHGALIQVASRFVSIEERMETLESENGQLLSEVQRLERMLKEGKN